MFSSQVFTSGSMQADAAVTSQDVVAKKARQEDKHTCVPVTISLVEQAVEQRAAGGGELCFHGSEAGVLVLVAMVESLTRQAAAMEFVLNDATGRIKARYYLSGRQPAHLDELAPGRYVSLFGAVRTAPEVHFAVQGMSVVQSADEVSYHMIEAAYAALKLQRGPAEPMTPGSRKPAIKEAEISPPKVQEAPMETPMAAQPAGQLSGSTLRKAMLKFIQKEAEGVPEGVSYAMLCNHVDATPAEDVAAALEKLVEAGEIYTTVDDAHFAAL